MYVLCHSDAYTIEDSTSSGVDVSTLFQLRNLINRRNVRKEPVKDVNAAEDFLQCVTEGHIIIACLEGIGMASINDNPVSITKSSLIKDKKQRFEVMLVATREILTKVVDFSRTKFEKSSDGVQECARDALSLGT